MGKGKPNILWIGVDELHIKTLGVYGGVNGKTPHIDSFAAESLVFDNAFCPTAVCAPTRASMLTGRLPVRGVLSATIWWNGLSPPGTYQGEKSSKPGRGSFTVRTIERYTSANGT